MNLKRKSDEKDLTKIKECAIINYGKVECYFNQARLYEELKNKEKAQEYYQKTLKIEPKNQKALEGLERIMNHEL